MEIKTSVQNATLKNSAKDFLAGKYYASVMTFLFYMMLSLLFVRFSNALTQQVCVTLMQLVDLTADSLPILILSYVIPFFVSILQNMIQIGVCLFFLNIACHQNYNTFDLLYGYSHQFGKTFCLSFVMTFLAFVAMLPANILIDMREKSVSLTDDTLMIILAVQAILCFAYLYFALSLSQIYYIALDYPELSVAQILNQSIKLMQGQKRKLFLLDLSFLPLLFLVLPTFGLGLFWILPYLSMTHCLFFLKLMQAEPTPLAAPSADRY